MNLKPVPVFKRKIIFTVAFVLTFGTTMGNSWAIQESADREIDRATESMREICIWFDCPDTNQELQMTEKELKRLDDMTFALFTRLSEVRKNEKLAQQFDADEFADELDAELEKIVGRDRLNRQLELVARYEFRRKGLAAAIARFSGTSIVLKGRALSKYQRASQKLAGELDRKKQDLRQECLSELSEILTSRQQNRLQEYLNLSNEGFEPPTLEALAWQLKYSRRIQDSLQISEITSFEALLWDHPPFRTDLAGLTECRIEGFRNKRDVGPVSSTDVIGRVSQTILAKLNPRQLNDGQVNVLRSLQAASRQFFASDESRLKSERTEFGKNVLEQVESMLSPGQISYFRLSASRRLLDNGGFVACLTAGELGNYLNITADQKKQFEEKATEWYQKLEAQSIEWEEEALQGLIESLPKMHQNEIKRIFGNKPESVRANLDLLVANLRNP